MADFNRACEEGRGKVRPLSGEPVYSCLCPACGHPFAPMFQAWTCERFLERIYNHGYVTVGPDYQEARPQQSRRVLNEIFGAQKDRLWAIWRARAMGR